MMYDRSGEMSQHLLTNERIGSLQGFRVAGGLDCDNRHASTYLRVCVALKPASALAAGPGRRGGGKSAAARAGGAAS